MPYVAAIIFPNWDSYLDINPMYHRYLETLRPLFYL